MLKNNLFFFFLQKQDQHLIRFQFYKFSKYLKDYVNVADGVVVLTVISLGERGDTRFSFRNDSHKILLLLV